MKFRNSEQMLDKLRKSLAQMDNATFFSCLGTSIAELRQKQAQKDRVNSSYSLTYNEVMPCLDFVAEQSDPSFFLASDHLFVNHHTLRYAQTTIIASFDQAKIA